MKSSIVYYVNEEKGVCIAKLPTAVEELYREFNNLTNSFNSFDPVCFFEEWYCKYGKKMNDLVGRAKCNIEDGDIFDVNFGKELAKNRLLSKINEYRTDAYSYVIECLDSMNDTMIHRMESNYRASVRAKQRITEVINNNYN